MKLRKSFIDIVDEGVIDFAFQLTLVSKLNNKRSSVKKMSRKC